MSPEHALEILTALADAEKAAEAAEYHKVDRPYLGIAVPQITELAREWRAEISIEERLELADALWQSGIHEAMVAGAKLLEQARIKPDDSAAWALIASWAPGFNGWAVSDHAAIAGQKRLVADPSRVAELEAWIASPNLWTRRAALVMTLPWAKMNNPKEADLEIREKVLGWAAGLVADRNWFMQKAVAGWVRDLSRHDKARAEAFIAEHAAGLKSFARKEIARFV